MSHLQILTLDYNHLDEYPKILNKLTSLKFLNISCNDIEILPTEIGHLTRLETFWCNNTGLLSIPEEIGNCDNLETFGARGNRITKIPQCFGLLTKLRWLTLESNRIRELPKAFEALDGLVHLNLKNNFIDKFPECLPLLKSLRYVFLNENQITDASIHRTQLESTEFISVLDLTDNPCASCESFVILTEDFSHVVLTKQQGASLDVMEDGVIEEDDNETRSDWENSVETSDINSTDDEDDAQNADVGFCDYFNFTLFLDCFFQDISLLIPQMSRFITSFN